jgi:hypothetical protein
LDRNHFRRHRLFAGGDQLVQMLDAEPDVLADSGAADLALPDRVSDPARGHVEVRRGFVDRQKRSLLRRRTRLIRRKLARPHTPERHGDNPWRSRRPRLSGYVVLRRDDAAKSAALATALDERAAQLAEADEARAAWYAHTAETRAAAERAASELAARQANEPTEPPPVTAEEWLAAHDAENTAEDPYRNITSEHDLADVADLRTKDQREGGHGKPLIQSPEPDIREEAAQQSTAEESVARNHAADKVRVPTADETAESVRRAQRALQELNHRKADETRHAEDEAQEESSRWHADEDKRATHQEARGGPTIYKDGQEALDALG